MTPYTDFLTGRPAQPLALKQARTGASDETFVFVTSVL